MQVNTRNSFLHGQSEVAASRYFVLYLTQICWLGLGAFLFANAYWPSACRPDSFVTVYQCSVHLPENRGWIEATLMTWLWSTPLLLALEILRRFNKPERR